MAENKFSELPDNTKILDESQEKWRNEAWRKTLEKHKNEIEKMLEKINLFDIWSNSLQNNEAVNRLIPEIFMDGYISIHFAGYGLYKYANVCLRSQLETVMRLIYFSTHSIEFNWWCKGNKWYRKGLKYKDVWGEGYLYFKELEYVKEFEKKCNDDKRLFRNGKNINRIYLELSEYVHSGVFSFQTKTDYFSPNYKIREFKKWANRFKKIQEYINILLILGFRKEFKEMSNTNQEKIIEVGIESSHYIKKLRKF